MSNQIGQTRRRPRLVGHAVHIAGPAVRVAIRATATLIGSTAIWVALGWVLGAMLDDRVEK